MRRTTMLWEVSVTRFERRSGNTAVAMKKREAKDGAIDGLAKYRRAEHRHASSSEGLSGSSRDPVAARVCQLDRPRRAWVAARFVRPDGGPHF